MCIKWFTLKLFLFSMFTHGLLIKNNCLCELIHSIHYFSEGLVQLFPIVFHSYWFKNWQKLKFATELAINHSCVFSGLVTEPFTNYRLAYSGHNTFIFLSWWLNRSPIIVCSGSLRSVICSQNCHNTFIFLSCWLNRSPIIVCSGNLRSVICSPY